MVHVHGAQVQQLVAQTRGLAPERLVAVPIDVGKGSAAALVCDFTGELLVGRFQFALTRVGVAGLVGRVQAVQAARPVELVRVGIEAAGHYHRPLSSAGVLPADWQLVEYNPAHVAAQRRTNGQRGVKTDTVDLAAISDLLVAGRGLPVGRTDPAMVELAGLVAHRARRVQVRSALKNQLLGQVDRCFPGLGGCLADLLGTKVGRLLVAEFADPARLAHLGPARFRGFAARRGVIVQTKVAEQCVAAARVALPTDQAAVARQVLADDLPAPGQPRPPDRCRRAAAGRAGCRHPVRRAEQRAGLGHPAGRRLRGCRRGACPLAVSPAAVPGRRAHPDPVRVGRAAPRRRDQPGRLGAAAPGAVGPWRWALALRPAGQGLCRQPAGARQARRGDRHRPGPPGQPDRLCHGP